METSTTNTLDHLSNSNWPVYLVSVFLISILFRIVISAMRAIEYSYSHERRAIGNYTFLKKMKITANGFSKSDPLPDLWYNTILGFFELLVFPFLMAAISIQ